MISMNFTVMTALGYCSLNSVVTVVKAESKRSQTSTEPFLFTDRKQRAYGHFWV